VDEGESLDAAAARELVEESGVPPSKAFMTQISTFGDPGRDPRGEKSSVFLSYKHCIETLSGARDPVSSLTHPLFKACP